MTMTDQMDPGASVHRVTPGSFLHIHGWRNDGLDEPCFALTHMDEAPAPIKGIPGEGKELDLPRSQGQCKSCLEGPLQVGGKKGIDPPKIFKRRHA